VHGHLPRQVSRLLVLLLVLVLPLLLLLQRSVLQCSC